MKHFFKAEGLQFVFFSKYFYNPQGSFTKSDLLLQLHDLEYLGVQEWRRLGWQHSRMLPYFARQYRIDNQKTQSIDTVLHKFSINNTKCNHNLLCTEK